MINIVLIFKNSYIKESEKKLYKSREKRCCRGKQGIIN